MSPTPWPARAFEAFTSCEIAACEAISAELVEVLHPVLADATADPDLPGSADLIKHLPRMLDHGDIPHHLYAFAAHITHCAGARTDNDNNRDAIKSLACQMTPDQFDAAATAWDNHYPDEDSAELIDFTQPEPDY